MRSGEKNRSHRRLERIRILGPGDEHRHGRQPAGQAVDLAEVADPVERPDEHLLQEVRDVFIGAQDGSQRQTDVLGVSIVEGRRCARMPGPQRCDQRGIVSDEGERGGQVNRSWA